MLSNSFSVNVWLFGNFTIDSKLFQKDGKEFVRQSYGGSVNFASQTLMNFFPLANCKIFTIGAPKSIQEKKLLKIIDMGSKNTFLEENESNFLTHYVLDYRDGPRRLLLKNFPSGELFLPIENSVPDIVMIIPIYHEITEETTLRIKAEYPTAFIACDPQGWVREKRPKTNEITIKHWHPSKELLHAVSVFKLSLEDVFLEKENSLESYIKLIVAHDVVLILTAGIKGSLTIIQQARSIICYYSPIVELNNVIDTTGAGDVWLMSFTLTYYQSKNIVKAISTASVLSSLKIQAEGTNFKTKSKEGIEKMIIEQEEKVIELDLSKGLKKIT
jgi:hypothetical protein